MTLGNEQKAIIFEKAAVRLRLEEKKSFNLF
jgi:hypothetical protein